MGKDKRCTKRFDVPCFPEFICPHGAHTEITPVLKLCHIFVLLSILDLFGWEVRRSRWHISYRHSHVRNEVCLPSRPWAPPRIIYFYIFPNSIVSIHYWPRQDPQRCSVISHRGIRALPPLPSPSTSPPPRHCHQQSILYEATVWGMKRPIKGAHLFQVLKASLGNMSKDNTPQNSVNQKMNQH